MRLHGSGDAFEAVVDRSVYLARDVSIWRLPKTGAKFIGRDKIIKQKVSCDYHGVVTGTGRAVFFDAKSCENQKWLRTTWAHVPDHQRAFLAAVGKAGAIAGLLAESTYRREVVWVPWACIANAEPSVAWDDPRVIRVCRMGECIPFGWMRKL